MRRRPRDGWRGKVRTVETVDETAAPAVATRCSRRYNPSFGAAVETRERPQVGAGHGGEESGDVGFLRGSTRRGASER